MTAVLRKQRSRPREFKVRLSKLQKKVLIANPLKLKLNTLLAVSLRKDVRQSDVRQVTSGTTPFAPIAQTLGYLTKQYKEQIEALYRNSKPLEDSCRRN